MRKIRDGMSVYKAKFWNYDNEEYFKCFIVADDFEDALDVANIFIKESAIDKTFEGKIIKGTGYALFGLWEKKPSTVLMRVEGIK